MSRTVLPIAILMLALSCSPARAQIVNTLRGFSDDEPGWSGDLSGYLDLSRGNTEYREYGAALTAQYLRDRHRFRALVDGLRKESRGEKIAESSRVHLRHNYWFAARWASILFVQNSRNPFQRLESRFLLGGGARLDLLRSEQLSVYLGMVTMLESERIQEDPRAREHQHRMSSFASVLYDVGERAALDMVAFFQPEWRDFADFRTVLSARLKVEIVGSLYLSLSYEFQQASRPPEGVGETDWNLRSGIGVEF